MKAKILILVCGLALLAWGKAVAQDITFTNLTLTFTNLQGTAYSNVTLVKADMDGIIWRSKGSGGRICFTNLAPDFLASLGVPEARIEVAAARAAHKTVSDAQYRAARAQAAQAQAKHAVQTKERAAEQERADAPSKARNAEMKADLAKIQALQAQIAAAAATRDALWDYYINTSDEYFSVTSGSRGSTADTAVTRRNNAYAADRQLEIMREQLSLLKAAFDAKYR